MKQQGDDVFTMPSQSPSLRCRPRRVSSPRSFASRARMLSGLALAGLASVGAGCGDGPICASDLAVFITTPDDGALLFEDSDPAPGVQSDVVVRTNLRETDRVELTVTDEFGRLSQYSAQVDPLGTAVFPSVQLPSGYTALEATGITSECGSSSADQILVLVGASGNCELAPFQVPLFNEHYAPLPVFNSLGDANPLTDDFQLDLDVYTLPGFGVQLFTIDLATGIETSAGTRITDGAGVAGYTVTLGQGPRALRAECFSLNDSTSFTSTTFNVYVDTEVPDCTLLSPAPGTTLDPLMDADGDPSNGTQIELTARLDTGAPGGLDDVVPMFILNAVKFEGSPFDEEGKSAVTVTIEQPGFHTLGISARDLAGNSCELVEPFEYRLEGLTAEAISRHEVLLSWIAPDVGGGTTASEYLVRIAEEPVDDNNFDDVGRAVSEPPAPGVPGTVESLVIEQLDAGKPYYVAVLAVNPFGDRVLVGTGGPVVPDFEATGAIGPIDPDEGIDGLGYQMAAGNFNGDEYGDLAVAAPFKSANGSPGAGVVYVYLGGPDGLSGTPDVTIAGSAPGGQLGNGLTAMRWNDDEVDDLVVGVPFGNGGAGDVHVFLGSDDFGAVAGPADADVTISGSNAAGDWFAASALGFALTTARFDDDARDDLILSAPGGGSGSGGVVVLYGGTTATDIVLSTVDAGGSGDAVALALEDPDPGSIFDDPPAPFFGHHLFPLGPTEGPSDTNDDIGVAYTEKSAAVVFRGRAQPESPGVTLASFDPTRDLEIRRATTDISTRFGTTMGSIDVNGTGEREIVVGMWRDVTNIGRIEIYDGQAVGVQAAVPPFRLGFITPSDGLHGLGSAVVNNAAGLVDPDVNGDGREDLIVVGGFGAGMLRMFVWYGGNIRLSGTTTATADHVITAPAPFEAVTAVGDSDATPIAAIWAGDVNGDGREDICWSDWSASGRDGTFELLYDDGPAAAGVPRAIPIDPAPESTAVTARAQSVMLGWQP